MERRPSRILRLLGDIAPAVAAGEQQEFRVMLFGEKQIHSCMHFSVWFATPSPANRHEEILTAYSVLRQQRPPGGLLLAGGGVDFSQVSYREVLRCLLE